MPTPTSLIIIGGDNQLVPLNTYTQQVVCYLRDENGVGMPFEPIVWSLPQGPTEPGGLFALSGYSPAPFFTTTDFVGRGYTEQDNLYTNQIAGSWLGLVQSVAVGTVDVAFNITNVNDPTPTTLTVSANGTQSAAQNTAYLPVSILVKDQFNAAMAGIAVSFTVPAGRGTWPGGGSLTRVATTNGSGIATSPVLTASATVGQFELTLAAGNVTNNSIVLFTTIDPAVVTSLSAYSGSNQVAAPLFPFGEPLVARAANALNQPVAGVSVLFTSPASGASCSFPTLFSTTTAISDANGLATTPLPVANATAGTYVVVASSTGIAGTFTVNFGMTNGGSPPDTANSLVMCEV